MSDNKNLGTVIWFNSKKGIGFLEWKINNIPQKDMFVHFSDVLCDGFKTLYKDQKVSFNIGANKRGEPKATEVEVIK